MEVKSGPGLKSRIRQKLHLLGVPILASDSTDYLSFGQTKNVHPRVILRALQMSAVPFARVVSFGVKIPMELFPKLDEHAT